MADDIVKEALEAFKIASDAESDNRQLAKDDIRFARLGEQWDAKIENDRRLAGRPCLTVNKLQPVIRQVVNDSRLNRPAIKIHPVDNGADNETAEILGGMVRNIEVSSDADVAYDTAIDSAVSGGFGYWRINLDYALNAVDEDTIRQAGASAFDQNIFIRRVANPFAVYGDPYSEAADSSDWNQCHVVEQVTADQFKKRFPAAENADFESDAWANLGSPWKDGDCVQIAEYWRREEVIKRALAVQLGPDPDTQAPGEVVILMEDEFAAQKDVLVAAGAQVIGQPRPVKSFKVTQHVVSGTEELEAVEWKGSYIPIIPVYGDEVNVEGKRHFRSLIRDSKDAQRNFNYWRTTATETVALAPRAPWLIEDGAIPNGWANKWSTANSQSHPYLLYKKGAAMPQRQPHAGVPTGMMQEALSAADDIKAITGIYDASLGARSNETSGVAIQTRQREGDVSTFHFIDNLTRAIRHSGRVVIDLIPKVYSSERIVRILGEDGKAEEVKINQEAMEGVRIHDVRTGRYDVTVTAGPGFSTRREEAAAQMIELIRSYPDAAPVIGDLLAKNLDWPGADEIAKRLEKALPAQYRDEQGQIDPQIQQQMQEMAGTIQQLMAKLAETQQQANTDNRKLDIEAYKAETDRIQALIKAQAPTKLPHMEEPDMGPGSFEQPDMRAA